MKYNYVWLVSNVPQWFSELRVHINIKVDLSSTDGNFKFILEADYIFIACDNCMNLSSNLPNIITSLIQYQCGNEHHGGVGCMPSLYSASPGYRSWSGDWLS